MQSFSHKVGVEELKRVSRKKNYEPNLEGTRMAHRMSWLSPLHNSCIIISYKVWRHLHFRVVTEIHRLANVWLNGTGGMEETIIQEHAAKANKGS